ncbi:hypothetical protein [Sandarakinorhabdus glacialis]|nr:hypothetical protein [Polymorphobacter glacialis]
MARLRRVETGAATALADLDQLIEAAAASMPVAAPKDKQWAR